MNAKTKKIVLEQEKKLKNFVRAVEKINKINEVVSIKQETLMKRRQSALAHQDLLKKMIQT